MALKLFHAFVHTICMEIMKCDVTEIRTETTEGANTFFPASEHMYGSHEM